MQHIRLGREVGLQPQQSPLDDLRGSPAVLHRRGDLATKAAQPRRATTVQAHLGIQRVTDVHLAAGQPDQFARFSVFDGVADATT